MRCKHAIALLVDGRREFVPCGKCNFCLSARRNDWTFRLRQELLVSLSAHFITLTYDDSKIPKDNDTGFEVLRKKDLQDFFKRLRKESLTKLRYYAVGEYGTRTARPHYHVLLYNATADLIAELQAIWGKGNILVGTVTDASIHYVTKYHVNKVGDHAGRSPPVCTNVPTSRDRC